MAMLDFDTDVVTEDEVTIEHACENSDHATNPHGVHADTGVLWYVLVHPCQNDPAVVMILCDTFMNVVYAEAKRTGFLVRCPACLAVMTMDTYARKLSRVDA